MKIRLLWIGKTRSNFLHSGIEYYLKLLRPLATLSLVEIKESRGKDRELTMAIDAQRILKCSQDYVLLDEQGKGYSSYEFAFFLNKSMGMQKSLDFVIGGAFGVSEEIKTRARACLSLSRMTMTHEMSRLVFLEQLYRAFTIIQGKEYHY